MMISILISLRFALLPFGNNLALPDVHFDSPLVLVHAKGEGPQSVHDGPFVKRHDVACNDFVVIDTTNDSAKVKG
jgi:ABC-type tungstate transport system permease subunit